MKIELKQVGLNELEQLQEIGRNTFAETFSSDNSQEDMQAYLDEKFSAVNMKKEMFDTNSQFYFAVLDERVVGYLKINFGTSQTEIKDPRALEIERIYVLKKFHGLKVGQFLYDKAIELAREKDLNYVWLGVWEKNQRAIGFYKKNGFVEFDRHIFRLGNDPQTDIMMKLEIKSSTANKIF